MPYLNLDVDYLDHPKTRRLVSNLGIGADIYPIRLWVHCAKFHARDGVLAGYSESEIEGIMGWLGGAGKAVQAMLRVGFLTKTPDGIGCTDWNDHQGHIWALKQRNKKNAKKRWDGIKKKPVFVKNKESSLYTSGNASGMPVVCQNDASGMLLTLPNLTLPNQTKTDTPLIPPGGGKESNAEVTLRNACNVRSEVKGSEVKGSKTSIAASQPQDTLPKPLSSVQKIVNAYKISRGIPKDDKSWDKANFSRYSKSAKAMLECFDGDVQKSVAYVLLKADQFREKGLEYTLETLARHAYDAKGGREEVPDDDLKKIEGGKNHAIPAVTLDEHRLLESRPGGGTSQAGEDGPEAWD